MSPRSRAVLGFLALAAGLGATGAPGTAVAARRQRPPPEFTDATAASGVDFTTLSRADGENGYGNGVAVADIDGDGDLDLFFPQDLGDSALYLNDGAMGFREAAAEAGVVLEGDEDHAKSAAFLDFDRDGAPDLFVGTAGEGNRLFRNDGDGSFTDVSGPSGVGAGAPFTMSAAVGDFDSDGFPDLYECNFQPYAWEPPPGQRDTRPAPNRLWRNRGDGTFEDVAGAAGVEDPVAAWAAHWLDVDGDGDQDLVVANDAFFYRSLETHCRVFLNGGPPGWEFEDLAERYGLRKGFFAMGIAAGDLDGDRRFDLYVTNYGPNVFLPGGGRHAWDDRGRELGIRGGRTEEGYVQIAWGAAIADLDMDGRQDLLVQSGTLEIGPEISDGALLQRPFLWRQHRRRRFLECAEEAGLLGTPTPGGRDAIPADLDGDGDLDLVVSTRTGPAVLFRNDTPRRSDWFGVRLVGARSERHGLGARLDLRARGRRVCDLVTTGGQPGGSLPTERILYPGRRTRGRGRLKVTWPSGVVQRVRVIANAWNTVREPEDGAE